MAKKFARKSTALDQDHYESDVNISTPKTDKSIYVFQRDKLDIALSIRELPWTEKQKGIIQLFNDKNTKVLFLKGAAGTSKTLLSMYCGLQALNNKKVSDMVLIRSAVESSDAKLGFLPGSADEKLAAYMTPFLDKFSELLPAPQIKKLQADNRIQMTPVGFIRGLHFSVKFVCCDEAQNNTLKENLTILSRVGNFCKVIMCGDPDQSDLPKNKSGFTAMYNEFNQEHYKEHGIYCVEFTEEDCVRSELCKVITRGFKNIMNQPKSVELINEGPRTPMFIE